MLCSCPSAGGLASAGVVLSAEPRSDLLRVFARNKNSFLCGIGQARNLAPHPSRMSWNTFGRVFRMTTWGESHGPALGAVVDGCPPGLELSEQQIQPFLDARRPGQSKFTTQRQEPDRVKILSGTFEGRTTGTPISLMI